MTRIFDVEDSRVKLNENVFLIPEFKTLTEKFEDPIPVFSFIHLAYSPDSPYANLEEDERVQVASDDAGGDFELTDEDLILAIDKAKKIMYTRTQRLWKSAGINLDRIAKFLEETDIEAGRDGSADVMYKWQNGLPKMLENYKKLERMAQEEQQTKLRGSAQMGMY